MADPAVKTDAEAVEADASGEFKPPKDGSWVPRERLNRALAKADAAQARLDELSRKASPAAKTPDRATLLAQVEAGKMTRAQAETVWEKGLVQQVADRVVGQVAAVQTQQTVQQRIAGYETQFPALKDQESDTFKAATAELQRLMELGLPDVPGTVLVAVEKVLGPLKGLAARQSGASSEEGGGAGQPNRRPSGAKLTWNDLDTRQKEYYDRAIDGGGYADRAAVLAQLEKYASGQPPRPR